jgi:protein O-mannosyl-transferase
LAYNGLGVIALKENNYGEAKTLFMQAVVLDGSLMEAHGNLGALEMWKGNPSSALKYLKTALLLNPGFVPARFNLGLCYLALGSPQKGEKHFLKLVAAMPDNDEARIYWGFAAALNKKPLKAARILSAVKEVGDGKIRALYYITKGVIYGGLNRTDEALKWIMKALEEEPENAEARYQLGLILLRSGKLKSSESCFRKIVSVVRGKFRYPGAVAGLIKILSKKGEKTEREKLIKFMRLNHHQYKKWW